MNYKINFKSLELKNYKSFESLNFEFQPGIHLISGENGAGKSSLIDAIPFATHDFCVTSNPSRNFNGNCNVKLTFQDLQTSNLVRIEKYIGDKVLGNSTKFFINEEDKSAKNKLACEKDIINFLGMSKDLFCSTVVVTQGLPFNISAMTPTSRKQIIEEMLGFYVWDKMKDKMSVSITDVNNRKNKIQQKLQDIDLEINTLTTKINTLTSVVKDSEQNIDEKYKIIRENLDSQLILLQNIENEIKNQSQGKTLSQLRETQGTMENVQYELNNDLKDCDHILTNKTCPKCGQDYPKSKFDLCESQKTSITMRLDKINTRLQELKIRVNFISNSYNDKIKLENVVESLSFNLKSLQKETKSDYQSDIENEDKRLQALQDKHRIITNYSNQLDSTISQAEYIYSLFLPSSKFRSSILKNYLNYVNQILRDIVPNMFDIQSFSIVLDKQDKGLEFEIKSKSGLLQPYKTFSGGEKRRIDIIIILSFQRFLTENSGISTNLIIFDEIFDNLDNKGIESVINCLSSLFPEDTCIYIVTHRNDFKEMFNSVINVYKEEGISYVG